MQRDVEISSKANVERFQDRSCHLVASLEIEMSRALRYTRPLSLIAIGANALRSGENGASYRQLNLEKRMRKLAPLVLRLPDFWGRIERLGFVIVLPETPRDGAAGAIRRMVETEPFQQMLREEQGRNTVVIGAAQFAPEHARVADLVRAAHAEIAWRSDAPADADGAEAAAAGPDAAIAQQG